MEDKDNKKLFELIKKLFELIKQHPAKIALTGGGSILVIFNIDNIVQLLSKLWSIVLNSSALNIVIVIIGVIIGVLIVAGAVLLYKHMSDKSELKRQSNAQTMLEKIIQKDSTITKCSFVSEKNKTALEFERNNIGKNNTKETKIKKGKKNNIVIFPTQNNQDDLEA